MKAAFIPVTLVLFVAKPSFNEAGKVVYKEYTEHNRRVVYSEGSYKDGVIKAAFALLNGTPIKLYKVRGLGLEEIKIDFISDKAEALKTTEVEPIREIVDPIDAICEPALEDDTCKTFEDLPSLDLSLEMANPEGYVYMPPNL